MFDVSARIMVGAEVVITHHVTLDRAGVVTEDVCPERRSYNSRGTRIARRSVVQPPTRPTVQHSRFRWARRTCRRPTRG